MLRRHLLFFVTGALLALAAVLIVRAGDDGSAAGRVGPGSTSTSPSAASAIPRSVRLRTHRRVLHGHRGDGNPATSSKAAPVRGTGGPARQGTSGAGTEPSPATATVPASTVPDDTTETVPGESDETAEPPADPSTNAAPPPDLGAGVTIPNPATPDASVSP